MLEQTSEANAARFIAHRQFTEWLRSGVYVDYPHQIALETIALCNAMCAFCPYPSLGKTGQRMPDRLIEKIVNDLTDVPSTVPIRINPSSVNELFLDRRIFDVFALINRKLPNGSLHIITNGSPLNDTNIDRLMRVENIVRFNVSLNEFRPDKYKQVMGLDFSRTVGVLDVLHRLKVENVARFPIVVSRVGDGTRDDLEFVEWAKRRYPAFETDVLVRGDFMHNVNPQRMNAQVPDVPCSQWFKLHIHVDGKVAFCCLDATNSLSYGDVSKQHLLEIYNHPERRRFRLRIPSRLTVRECLDCRMIV